MIQSAQLLVMVLAFLLGIDADPRLGTFDAIPTDELIETGRIVDGQLLDRFRPGILFRKTPDGEEVLFDGTVFTAIRWTAIAICMTVGGSVFIVFMSLLRPFLTRTK